METSSCGIAAHRGVTAPPPPRTPDFPGFTELRSVQFLPASAAARLLGLRVRKSPEAWSSLSFVNVVCCQVEVSATDRSLV